MDTAEHNPPTALTSSLLKGNAALGTRMAISAATLVEDDARDGEDIISSFLSMATADSGQWTASGAALGAFSGVLGIWGGLLKAYSRGADAAAGSVGSFLRSIPGIGATPLASWAERALDEAIRAVGLEGADLSAPKPVVVNTLHVSQATDAQAAAALARVKGLYASVPGSGSGCVLGEAAGAMLQEAQAQAGESLGQRFTLFTIGFGDWPGAPQIPVQVSLPQAALDRGRGAIGNLFARIGSVFAGGGDEAIWE
jgi:hypothetical protein